MVLRLLCAIQAASNLIYMMITFPGSGSRYKSIYLDQRSIASTRLCTYMELRISILPSVGIRHGTIETETSVVV